MGHQKLIDLVTMLQNSLDKFSNLRMFGTKHDGHWTWTTYQEFGEMVDHCRAGLKTRGISAGDSVAVISSNRVEWAVLAYATYSLGARFVPMYEHQREVEWKYMINDAQVKLLVVSTPDIYNNTKNWSDELKNLQNIFCIELNGTDSASFTALLEEGFKNPAEAMEINPQTICGIIYTSGTTGKPKGVLLSHANIISNINAAHEIFPLEPDDCSVSFLPWAHSFGQTVELHAMISMGCSLAFAESIDKLIQNFEEIRPTVLLAVPRIFTKIYSGLQTKMDAAGGFKRKLFYQAMNNAKKLKILRAESEKGLVRKLFWGTKRAKAETMQILYDRLVFSKVRKKFGGRLKYAFSGGAALALDVAEFIDNLGIMVYEGYGLTETSPISSGNYRNNRKIGSVGKAIPGVTIKIDTSVAEDLNNDGEVIVYGPNIMKGYHNLPEETAKVMTDDGGFRTGDRGYLDKDGYLYITGRIKEQYKLENGKYVVPAPLEEMLQLSPYILQAYIDGANRSCNVALIVPNRENLISWAKRQGLESEPFENLLQQKEVQQLIRSQLDEFSKNFKGYERIKKFSLIAEEFTTENGLLTPKLSVKRHFVAKRHDKQLKQLWE